MTTNAATAPEFFIATCGRKHVARFTAAEWTAARIDNGFGKYGYAQCPAGGCGQMTTVRAIRATVTRTECGPRCTSALGPSCDCKCGGENHAADHGHGARTVEIPVAEDVIDRVLAAHPDVARKLARTEARAANEAAATRRDAGRRPSPALPARQLALELTTGAWGTTRIARTADEDGAQLDLFEAVAESTR